MSLVHKTPSWSVLAVFCAAATAFAEPWPQWRGSHADGISRETGLLGKWPDDGPAVLWRAELGGGFSSVSVAGGRAYTMFGTAEGEFVACFDAASGKLLWKTRCAALFTNTYGDGPRATPAIDNGRVYALSGNGGLVCLDSANGKELWSYRLTERFGGAPPDFGFSASPVVIDQMLVVVVGGGKGKSLAALDKTTGKVLWTSLDDKAGYSTPIHVTAGGVPQIIVLMGEALVGVAPSDGHELWRHPWKTELDANVATPIVHQDRVFVSTGYGTGSGLWELSAAGGKPSARLLWANKNMKNYFSTSVLIDGHLYGFNNTMLVCMDFATGDVRWKQRGFNRGSLLAADGKLIILGERATLALAVPSPESYQEISKASVLTDRTWTVPTLSDGRLFIRNEKELVALGLTR